MKELWGGRFERASDPLFADFNASLGVDARLWRADISGSMAWARALRAAKILTDGEHAAIERGLAEIAAEIEAEPALLARSTAEDVHTFVEGRLTEKIGEPAKKLHTGRSRNDQVATDLKLYLRAAGARIDARIQDLVAALVTLAEPNASLAMPGYTHLQRAQPITVGHHLLAYVEMFARDRRRLRDALAGMDACPLGSGALAGTAFAIDRAALARDLGFALPTANSLDAVSDRDHACELAFVASLAMVHLSRFAEDWIFFATQEARFLQLDDEVASGSSLMPQKKNPDALELLRGKTGRVLGDLQALLVTLKGLPLAYDKDLQEDKHALFDALDTLESALAVGALVVRHARFDADRCRSEALRGHANATDLADWLVKRGVPFRTAHERAGLAVRAAIEAGVELGDLPQAARDACAPELAGVSAAEWRRALSIDTVLANRGALGGTAPALVSSAVQAWKERLRTWKPLP
ncbi:MAG: argininosuccinate lyase [Planctomycetota bacterium]